MKKLILVSAISAVFASQAYTAHATSNSDMITVSVFHKVHQADDKTRMQRGAVQQFGAKERVFATQYNAAQVIRNATYKQCIDAGNTGEQWCLPVRDKVVELDTFSAVNSRSGNQMSIREAELQNQLMSLQYFQIPRYGMTNQEVLKAIYEAGIYEYVEAYSEARSLSSSFSSSGDYAFSTTLSNTGGLPYESDESDLFSDDYWNHQQQGRYLFAVGTSPDASGIASVMARTNEGNQSRYPVFVVDGGFEVSDETPYAETRNFVSSGPTSWREQGPLDITVGNAWGGYEGCDGHGMAVSHIMAGTQNSGSVTGIAKNADIHALRVLPCGTGSPNDVLDALLWLSGNNRYEDVRDNFTMDPLWEFPQEDVYEGPPGVVNLSLGWDTNVIKNGEILEYGPPQCGKVPQLLMSLLVEKGFTVVGGPGNDNQDAWNRFPTACDGVISVGALDRNGEKAGFSNWGKGSIDVFAPGQDIYAHLGIKVGNFGVGQPSGTSMSSPIVAGLIAETQRHFDVAGMDALTLLRFTAFDPSLNGSKLDDGTACEAGVCGAGRIDGEAFFQAAKAFSEGRLHRISPAISGMSDSETAWYEEHFDASGKAQGTYKLEFFDGNGQAHHYFKLAESFKGDDFKGDGYHVVGEFRSGVEYTNAVNPSSSSYAFQVCTDDEGCSGDWHVISDLASEESQNTRILSSLTKESNSSLNL